MTDAITSADIRAELAANSLALGQARDDMALYERLTGAKSAFARRVKQADDLTDKLAKTLETEAKAARDALFKNLANLRITETVLDPKAATSILNTRYTITYTTPIWDGFDSVSTTVTKAGFGSLDANVTEWLLSKHADKIPSSILALVPGDPRDALDAYRLALGRGFLKS
ncbi:MAG TPA: hypothetical protein VF463_07770 [Sphingobium sp.]